MKIGVLKEIKKHEYRTAITPNGVKMLTQKGHKVLVEKGCGLGVGFSDETYKLAGATIVTNDEVFAESQMIVKVKEPLAVEYKKLKPEQVLFTYLHLAPDPEQVKGLLNAEAVAIAYETVTDSDNNLPLLRPMSEIAGRLSIQAGAYALQKNNGGKGVLIGGALGVFPAKVLILGGGIVGINAAKMAVGMGAQVTIMDISIKQLALIDQIFGSKIRTLVSNEANLLDQMKDCDLLIGAVLIPGAAAPKLIKKHFLKLMQPGSVIVDVAIDQGGVSETSKPTTHDEPTYTVDNVVHYCVTNMPGAVAHTSTLALTNSTLPYILEIADKGYKKALIENEHLKNGLNIYKGQVTNRIIADIFKYKYQPDIK